MLLIQMEEEIFMHVHTWQLVRLDARRNVALKRAAAQGAYLFKYWRWNSRVG